MDSIEQLDASRPRKKRKITHAHRGSKSTLTVGFDDDEPLDASSLEDAYHISKDQRHPLDIGKLLGSSQSDPAFKVYIFFSITQKSIILTLQQSFYHDLQGYILSKLLGRDYDGDELNFSLEERRGIRIQNNRIYKHKVLRVHYTTYDMRRTTDSINPRLPGHAHIMLNGPDGTFWYARVIGVFHVNVRLAIETDFRRLDFVWVRWFGQDTSWKSGPSAKRLPRLGFIHHSQTASFGFVDPIDVVRATHLIPAFAHGKTNYYLPQSGVARTTEEGDEDWTYHYVNM